MIQWEFFPKSNSIPEHLKLVVDIFIRKNSMINSENHKLHSNVVLEIIREDLMELGYRVEAGKRDIDKIKVPVLYGRNGIINKYFEADAYNKDVRTVIEVEAGRGVMNYQFLKDLFQATMMQEVDLLVIAIRNRYLNKADFEEVINFFETLYTSNRLVLPLKGVLIVGY